MSVGWCGLVKHNRLFGYFTPKFILHVLLFYHWVVYVYVPNKVRYVRPTGQFFFTMTIMSLRIYKLNSDSE